MFMHWAIQFNMLFTAVDEQISVLSLDDKLVAYTPLDSKQFLHFYPSGHDHLTASPLGMVKVHQQRVFA